MTGPASGWRTAVVIIASTRAATGVYPDRTGPVIVEWLTARGFVVDGPLVRSDGPDVAAALRQAVGVPDAPSALGAGAAGERAPAADLVITSYTLLRLEAEHYRALPCSALFLDEAQFVKNYRSATYQAVRRVGAVRTFVITGTPLENSLMDLWSMLSLAAPGLFPRPESFTERYRKPI